MKVFLPLEFDFGWSRALPRFFLLDNIINNQLSLSVNEILFLTLRIVVKMISMGVH